MLIIIIIIASSSSGGLELERVKLLSAAGSKKRFFTQGPKADIAAVCKLSAGSKKCFFTQRPKVHRHKRCGTSLICYRCGNAPM